MDWQWAVREAVLKRVQPGLAAAACFFLWLQTCSITCKNILNLIHAFLSPPTKHKERRIYHFSQLPLCSEWANKRCKAWGDYTEICILQHAEALRLFQVGETSWKCPTTQSAAGFYRGDERRAGIGPLSDCWLVCGSAGVEMKWCLAGEQV